jgi:serine/threonine protein kinase
MTQSPPNYQLVRKLGDGALAEVFLAQENGSDPLVLFQLLGPDISADPAAASRLLEDASVWANLEHPNVARQLRSGRTAEGCIYLVSEYFEGEDLASYLKMHPPLSGEELIQLILPVCAALDYLHQRGVVHGNIRPANILLHGGLRALQPKLMSSGWALLGDRSVAGSRASPPGVDHFPPERAQNGKPDPRWDIYGLGAVIYEALTGRPPFLETSVAETIEQSARERLASITGPSAYLSPVVERCLATRPQDRFATAGEVAAALQKCRPSATLAFATKLPDSSPPLEAREKEGDVLGSYELVKLIGEGSMGRVFLARHARLGRQVALKVMRPEHLRTPHLVQRFFQEARSVNQINHEHIVEVFDFVNEVEGSDSGRAYCVMELLVGASLAELLRKQPLAIERIVHITRQVCAALEAAHQLGVVHRDVKPDNIFITERNGDTDFTKVLDFGVAKLTSPIGEEKASETIEGTIVGTPAYMAPEQAAGLGADHRADIYGVGVVLYEILAGHPPFESTSFGQLVVQIITKPPPPLPALTPGGERIPARLKSLVMACLEKEPQNRPHSMDELSQQLGKSLGGSNSWPRRLGKVWVVGASALVLASVGVVTLSRSRHVVSTDRVPALPTPAAVQLAPEDLSLKAGSLPDPGQVANLLSTDPPEPSINHTDARPAASQLGGTGQAIPAKSAPKPIPSQKKKISPDGIINPFER